MKYRWVEHTHNTHGVGAFASWKSCMSYCAMNNMSEVLFRIFATLNRIVIFMFKIILAIKSSNKSRTLATLTIKLHLVDFHMRSASWKTMDQMQMAMKVFCKTRTRIKVRKSTPVLMAKTVTVIVWVPEIFMKSNKTLWASDCVLSKLHRSKAGGFF